VFTIVVLLGFWCLWSLFFWALLAFMFMLSWTLGVHAYAFWALLVFLVIAFMGFIGVNGRVILVSTIVHVVGSWILMGKS